MTAWEVAANASTALSIALAARNNVHTWWTGIVGCVLFAGVFGQHRLYADALLQGFFIATSLIGWYRWSPATRLSALPVTHLAWSALAPYLVLSGLVTVGYGAALHAWSDAVAPFPDSAVLAFSALAQMLLMGRRVETWPLWLLVNTIAVPLFASRGLWLTAGLYGVYWCNAWYGWARWRRLADGG